MLHPRCVRHELQRQRCKACWSADGFDFTVPNEVWAAVVPTELQGRVVCLACFDGFAAAKGIDYAPHVTEVCFAGRRGSFGFAITYAVPVDPDAY